MSNTTTAVPTIDIAGTAVIILTMDRYMIVILYIIGILGAILNIITFFQKQIRTNPYSVYFLSTSIVDFFIMNVFILMEIITTFNKPLSDLIYSTRIWCKLGNYIMFLLPCLSSSYITLATIDRFCISSLNRTVRKWSNLKVSRIVVGEICVVLVLFGLHIPIAYDWIEDPSTKVTRCSIANGSPTAFIIIHGFFFALYKVAITPFLLCIFGLLIYYNMKQSRQRVSPQHHTRFNRTTTITGGLALPIYPIKIISNRNNHHMLAMLIVQVILTVISNIPYMAIYLFGYFNPVPKDLLQLLLYIIFSFIARWFYYINYCKTFYINTLTSKLFRKSLHQQFSNLFRPHIRE